ncbi:hypothetical protein D3C81_1970070 [compost metagenome]
MESLEFGDDQRCIFTAQQISLFSGEQNQFLGTGERFEHHTERTAFTADDFTKFLDRGNSGGITENMVATGGSHGDHFCLFQ